MTKIERVNRVFVQTDKREHSLLMSSKWSALSSRYQLECFIQAILFIRYRIDRLDPFLFKLFNF